MEIELKEIKQWKSLRKKLKDKYEFNSDWNRAIDLFNKRLDKKFFNPIEQLIERNEQKGEGFTILTTQCALIESLATYRKGKIFNHRKNTKSPKFEYSRSAKLFVDFLLADEIFENNFWQLTNGKKEINKPQNAQKFYSDVRCGLMHEARTKNEWFINTTKKSIKTETVFLEKQGDKIKILRSILHYRLKQAVNTYSSDLRADNKNGVTLRRYFGRKLDHLFDIKRDTNYDWWKE